MKRYREIASIVAARLNCAKSNNREWQDKHGEWLEKTAKNGPSGSGIDCGTKIDLDASTGEKLVFHVAFHHMNDVGMYDGWTEHVLTVRPSLQFGFVLSFSGRDRNQIKDYLHEVYGIWLHEDAGGLIAAAPELLEILGRLQIQVSHAEKLRQQFGDAGWDEIAETCAVASAAIAKAR